MDPDIKINWFVHQGEISGGTHEVRNRWRELFAEALLQWNVQKGKTS